jgi:hypothetical protein
MRLVRRFAVVVCWAAVYQLLRLTSEYRDSGFTISKKTEKKIFPGEEDGAQGG